MGWSEETDNLGLPLFTDVDRPSWRGDVNYAFSRIDHVLNETGILDATQYGVVGDGVTDDSIAIRDLFRIASEWSPDETGQRAAIFFPVGEYIISQNNVFADLLTLNNNGLNIIGAGMSSTRFHLVTGGVDMWFYDNGDNRRWNYVTISDCTFTTDGPNDSLATVADQHGGFAKISSTGHEQFFKFFRVHFEGPWKTFIETAGTGNADQVGLFACKVQDVYDHLMYINNQQSVIHEWYNVTATRLYGNGFTVGPNGGGDVKLIGGSWILMGKDSDTTQRYLFNLPNAGLGLGAGNGTFSAWGVKVETHRAHMGLVRTPDNAVVRVSFRDSSLWTTLPSIAATTIEQVIVGRRGHVIFSGCSLSPKFAARVVGGTSVQRGQDAETLLMLDSCYVPSDITSRISIVDTGRAIGRDLRGTDSASVQQHAMDFDMGWDTGSNGGPSTSVKRVAIRRPEQGWPAPTGGSERTVKLPIGALITGVYARRPGAGSHPSDTYRLHVGSDDKTTTYASSDAGVLASSDAVIDDRPMVDVGSTDNRRTVRLWASGEIGSAGIDGIAAWVDYV